MFFQSRMQLKIAVGLILLNLPLGWLICSNLGTVVEFQGGWFAKYSVLSIKRTVLLKVLLPKNARCVNTFPFSGNKSKTFEFKNISTHFVPYIRKYLGREILRTVYFSKNLYQKYGTFNRVYRVAGALMNA